MNIQTICRQKYCFCTNLIWVIRISEIPIPNRAICYVYKSLVCDVFKTPDTFNRCVVEFIFNKREGMPLIIVIQDIAFSSTLKFFDKSPVFKKRIVYRFLRWICNSHNTKQ